MDFYNPPNPAYEVKAFAPQEKLDAADAPAWKIRIADGGAIAELQKHIYSAAIKASHAVAPALAAQALAAVARPKSAYALGQHFTLAIPPPTTSITATPVIISAPATALALALAPTTDCMAGSSLVAGAASFSWKIFSIRSLYIILFIELYVCIRQWRLRTAKMPKGASAQNDIVRGRVAYNMFHSALSAGRVALIIGFELVPWLWISIGQLQDAFLPTMSERMTDSVQSAGFFVACGLFYMLLHLLDFGLLLCFKGESGIKTLFHNWTPSNIVKNMASGRPISIVLFLSMIITLITKLFVARITPILRPALLTIQFLFIVFYPLVSQPHKSTLTLMEDEVLVEAITELATTAKLPLKNIWISDQVLSDAKLEDEGVRVSGWPRKNQIVVNQRMLSEFSSEDTMALVAHALGAWKSSVHLRKIFIAQVFFYNVVNLLISFVNSGDMYRSFGFSPVAEGKVYPGAAALVLFGVGVVRPFSLYYNLLTNVGARSCAFQADKYATQLGHSSELSAVLSKIATLNVEEEVEFVDDKFYSVLYDAQPKISQRLVWLEEERVKEDAKEGVIRLPVGDNEKH